MVERYVKLQYFCFSRDAKFFYESFRKVSHRIWVFPRCILNNSNRSYSSFAARRKKIFISLLFMNWKCMTWIEKNFLITAAKSSLQCLTISISEEWNVWNLSSSKKLCISKVSCAVIFHWKNSSVALLLITHQRHSSLWAHLKINLLALRAYFYWFCSDFHFGVINRFPFLFIDLLFLQDENTKLIYVEDEWQLVCKLSRKTNALKPGRSEKKTNGLK